MTIFTKADENRLDWLLLREGSVKKYYQEEHLSDDLQWLDNQGYKIVNINCSKLTEIPNILKIIGQELDFPDFFRGNDLDAFDDHMYDIQISSESGIVIVFYRYDLIMKLDPKIGWNLVNILDNHSRSYMMYGLRLITLLQSADPKLEIDPIGTQNVKWNQKEWLDSHRGL